MLTVEKFELHSAAEFLLNESLLYFEHSRNIVAFLHRQTSTSNPDKAGSFQVTAARDFETHKVYHSNNQNTLPPIPSNRFFYHPDSGCSRDQPRPGSLFPTTREAEERDPGNEVE